MSSLSVRLPLTVLSGVTCLLLGVSCTSTNDSADGPAPSKEAPQTQTTQEEVSREEIASFQPAPNQSAEEEISSESTSSNWAEDIKQCATWQDFIAYNEESPVAPDLPFPSPPERFLNGCITADATGSALNIYITENDFDNGTVMPTVPDSKLVRGFIPVAKISRGRHQRSTPDEPEKMHIGFSSRQSRPNTSEGYYEVLEDNGYASYQYLFANHSDVPSWELAEMLEEVKAEWEANY
ncbi:hypothetical protein S7335_256 [Synechococcus sp. PCC 7335]|uniref:hypothetical protein n=1 Tax=Synechococcus sp. (strain ATCC 29403 / PCC 7335) TaxID=91464 RepID=UPI00017ED2C1|nr:hypothetical protein [Synechococcus sp. PCC 7335]EDX83078.1 hypothetical protein S7335_256 [Synechococcus sp. PCC 7335]